MKKSKVIIPAMALLLFSTAASITGTVAWFTSSRTFSTTAGDFAVANVDGNLDVTLAGGVGTKAVKDDGTAPGNGEKATKILVKDTAKYKFTHGSFNHASTGNDALTAWTLNKDSTGTSDKYKKKDTLTAAEADETKWVGTTTGSGDNAVKYFVAMSWSMTFKYEFNQEANNVGVYFNQGTSTISHADPNYSQEAGKTKFTINGFRVAFLPSAGGNAKIWGKRAKSEGGAVDANSKYPNFGYVTGAATADVDHYTTTEYIENDSNYTAAVDETAETSGDNADRIDRLFTITKPVSPATYTEVTVKCVVWFEGEDPDVISEAEMDTVKLKLDFYARSDFAA